MVDYADTPMSSNFDGGTRVRPVDDKGEKRKLLPTNNEDGFTVYELKKKKSQS